MKKSFVSVIFTVLGLGAFADSVTAEMASSAANAWVAKNGALGAGGTVVGDPIPEYDEDGTTLLWWTVKMSNGGAVFVAPDTGIEPVIASTRKYGAKGLEAGNPLRALLKLDLRRRVKLVSKISVNRVTGGARLASVALPPPTVDPVAASVTASQVKWSRLTATRASGAKLAAVTSANPTNNVYVVPGFEDGGVYTYWNQTTSDYSSDEEGKLFNLYTPKNCPCGCVATAGAALLQYFNATNAPKLSRVCKVNGAEENLQTSGKNYNWALLPDELGGSAGSIEGSGEDEGESPEGEPIEGEGDGEEPVEPGKLSKAQMAIIGHAASDMGICLEMGYTEGGSGAYTKDMAKVLGQDFGLSSARWIQSPEVEDYGTYIYDEITNGYPVALSIQGESFGPGYASADVGHAVLGVGYAEGDAEEGEEPTIYTRVFLGWGGSFDGWYALPSIVVDYGGYGIDWEILQGIVTQIRNEDYHTTFEKARAAALAADPVKPILMVSGLSGSDENATKMLDYLREHSDELSTVFEIGWTTPSMPDGDAVGVSVGVFNPNTMKDDGRWFWTNGSLSYGHADPESEWSEVEAMFQRVVAEGLKAMAQQNSGIVLNVATSIPNLDADKVAALPALGTYDCLTTNMFTVGEQITATCSAAITNEATGYGLACSGWILTNETTGAVLEGTGTTATFSLEANTTSSLIWQITTNLVKITVSPTLKGRFGTVEPGTGWYPYGDAVAFTAIPANNCKFDNYSTILPSHNVAERVDAGYAIAWVALGPCELTANFSMGVDNRTDPEETAPLTMASLFWSEDAEDYVETAPAGFVAPKTAVRGLKNPIEIADGESADVPATTVILQPAAKEVTLADGSTWECVGWYAVADDSDDAGDVTSVAVDMAEVTDGITVAWLWACKEQIDEPEELKIEWDASLSNLDTDFTTNLLTKAQFEAMGKTLDEVAASVSVPKGWKAKLQQDANGDVVASLELDEDALSLDGTQLTIASNADGSFTVQADIANGVKGFWYSLYATDDLTGTWSVVASGEYQAGEPSTQATVDAALNLEIQVSPEDSKKFYKVVVTVKQP